jgi:hypothetical protein
MKKPKKSAILVEGYAQATSLCPCSAADLRRAKKNGCQAFFPGGRIDLDRLRAWLKTHPVKQPRKVDAKALPTGPGPALHRLEQAESAAYASLLKAADHETVTTARAWWLRCGEQLRRHRLAISETERVGTAVLSRRDVEALLSEISGGLDLLPHALSRTIAPAIAGLPTAAAAQVLETALSVTTSTLMSVIPHRGDVPAWAVAALGAPAKPVPGLADLLAVFAAKDARTARLERDLREKARAEGLDGEYYRFKRWLEMDHAISGETREAWLRLCVAAGRAVPDATEKEVRSHPGLKTRER